MKSIAIAALLLASACKPLTSPVAGTDPSDPDAPAPRVRAQSPLATYSSQRPVEPASWREQNERVAPQQKGR
jgi:hypothetical protein